MRHSGRGIVARRMGRGFDGSGIVLWVSDALRIISFDLWARVLTERYTLDERTVEKGKACRIILHP